MTPSNDIAPGNFDKAKVMAWLRDVDGHGLFAKERYLDLGFNPAFVALLERVHVSDGTHKGTIFKDGEIVHETIAIYELEFLEALVQALGLQSSGYMMRGRGSAARLHAEALMAYVRGLP